MEKEIQSLIGYTLYRNPDISKWIKISRLRWAENDGRGNTKANDSATTRWQEGKRETKIAVALVMRKWKVKALDWEGWKKLLEVAQTLK